jgi:hypothetical protein
MYIKNTSNDVSSHPLQMTQSEKQQKTEMIPSLLPAVVPIDISTDMKCRLI